MDPCLGSALSFGDGWSHLAACRGEETDRWFDCAEVDSDTGRQHIEEAGLAYARSKCFECPVSTLCFSDTMDHEDGSAEARRFGVFGGLTPAQRASLWRRGRESWTCWRCESPLEPRPLMSGERTCPDCGDDGSQAPVSDYGDQWVTRHTTLAKVMLRWVVENFEAGDDVPSPTRYAKDNGVRKDDAARVMRAFVEDGIVSQTGRGRYVRNPGRRALRQRGRRGGPLASG